MTLFAVQMVDAAYDTDSLVGYWRLDATSGITYIDSSGHNQTGTATGAPSISLDIPSVNFTNDRSLDFDGTADFLDIGDYANLEVEDSLPFSISLWFNPSSSPGADKSYALVAKGTPSVAGYAFQYEQISSNFVINLSKYGVQDQRVTITELTTGTWYHLTAVQTSTQVEYFINGSSVGTYSNASAYNASGTNGFRIGSSSDGDLYTNGLIDDVRVYSRALSDTEVAELGAGNYTTAIWNGSSNANFETAANWNINAVPDPYTNIIIPKTTRHAELSATVSGASLTIEASSFTGASLDLHGFNFEFVDSGELKGGGILKMIGSEMVTGGTSNLGTSSTGTILYYGTGSYTGLPLGDNYYTLNINDGLIGYWNFDVQEGSYVPDISGHDRDGVRATSPASPSYVSTTAPTAYFNRYAMDFDGDDDYVSLGTDPGLNPQKAITISAWINMDTKNDYAGIVFRGNGNNTVFGMRVFTDSTISGIVRNSANSATAQAFSPSAISTGKWEHIALTYDGLTATVYQNGIAGTPVSQSSGNGIRSASLATEIGRDNYNSSRQFDGLIDDVRIYNRVLQKHEISALAAGHQPATASGTFTLDTNLTVANDLVLTAGDLDRSASNYSVTLSGSWLNYGGQFSPRSGTVTFEGSGESDLELRSGGQAFTNLTINNSSTWTLRDLLDVDGTLTLSSGTIDASTNNYSLHAYDIDQTGGTFTPPLGCCCVKPNIKPDIHAYLCPQRIAN